MKIQNLFRDLPQLDAGEAFETLLTCRNVVIERISSSERVEPTLYDQVQDFQYAQANRTALFLLAICLIALMLLYSLRPESRRESRLRSGDLV